MSRLVGSLLVGFLYFVDGNASVLTDILDKQSPHCRRAYTIAYNIYIYIYLSIYHSIYLSIYLSLSLSLSIFFFHELRTPFDEVAKHWPVTMEEREMIREHLWESL